MQDTAVKIELKGVDWMDPGMDDDDDDRVEVPAEVDILYAKVLPKDGSDR